MSNTMSSKKIGVSASLLAANSLNLEKSIDAIIQSGADSLHIDIMDGIFVPNFGIGLKIIEDIEKNYKIPIHIHLMVQKPETSVDYFLNTSAKSITIHIESECNKYRTIQKIKNANKYSGIAINLDSNPDNLKHMLEYIDLLTIMLVHPGFAGQNQHIDSANRVLYIKKLVNTYNKNIEIICDGGINIENSKELINSGANTLVIGSGLFSKPYEDYKTIINNLRCL